MTQLNFLVPIRMSERQSIQCIPPPYSAQNSPYSRVKDFSKMVRHELQTMQRKFMLRPCKVILVGDVSVGKTTIVNRFCYDKFQANYKATIGVDFEIENFTILGHNYCLEMWDTAGQERFKCIAQSYYRNANIIIVVFDMSNKETLQSTTTWLKNALAVNSIQKPLLFLVGTKSDLVSQDDFHRTEKLATEVAEGIKAEYWSVSARTGFNIVKFFHRIAALAFESAMKEAIIEQNCIEKNRQKQEQSQTLDSSKFSCEKFSYTMQKSCYC